MDRLSHLRGEAGGSGDSTFDTTSPPSEAYISANESSKYFSMSDSTFDMSPIKDVSLASAAADPERTITETDDLMPNLSPIDKKDILDSYKMDNQLDSANILSGGVDLFEDNENSFDGNELVIDDNAEIDEKSIPDKSDTDLKSDDLSDVTLKDAEPVAPNKNIEVLLQIDGSNVKAVDIGNGLYLYRKEGQEELAAVQILEGEQPQSGYKFLKVRENVEGNLEVYEEIAVEVTKEAEGKLEDKNTVHAPIKDINDPSSSNKISENKPSSQKEIDIPILKNEKESEIKDLPTETKTEYNLNGKMMKFSESRKSPVVGSFTPMTFHSTPNKEGKPLTKTMVDLQLHPNRHSDNIKTIEVHTDGTKQKHLEQIIKTASQPDTARLIEFDSTLPEKIHKEQDKDAIKTNIEDRQTNPKTDVHIQAENIEKGKLVQEKSNTNKQITKKTGTELFDLGIIEETNEIASNAAKIILCENSVKLNTFSKTENDSVVQNSSTKCDASEVTTGNPSSNLSSSSGVKDEKLVKISTTNRTNNTIKNHHNIVNENVVGNACAKSDKSDLPAENPFSCDGKDEQSVYKTTKNEINNTIKKPTKKVHENLVGDSCPTSSDSSDFTAQNPSSFGVNDNKPLKKTAISTIENQVVTETLTENSGTKCDISDVTEENLSTSCIKDSKSKDDVKDCINLTDNSNLISLKIKSNDAVVFRQEANEITIQNTSFPNECIPKVVEPQVEVLSKDTMLPCSLPGPHVSKSEDNKKTQSKDEQVSFVNTSLSEDLKQTPTKQEHVSIADVSQASPECKISATNIQMSSRFNDDSLPLELKSKQNSDNNSKIKHIKLNSEIEIGPSIQLENNQGKNKEILKDSKLLEAVENKTICTNSNKVITVIEDANLNEFQDDRKLVYISDTKEKAYCGTDLKGKIEVDAININDKKENINEEIKKSKNKSEYSKQPLEPETSVKFLKPVTNDQTHIIKSDKEQKPNPADIKAPLKIEDMKVNVAPTKEIFPSVVATGEKVSVNKNNLEELKRQISKPTVELTKGVNYNHNAPAVPFGKWTEVNRQEFLNKFKEVKAPSNTNSKQIKNSNDLNRRDVLKKIDSQRQQTIINNASAKAQEKLNIKNETVFSSKVNPSQLDIKESVKSKLPVVNPKADSTINMSKLEVQNTSKLCSTASVNTTTTPCIPKEEALQRREVNAQDLIDKTIEDMINRLPTKNVSQSSEVKPTQKNEATVSISGTKPINLQQINKTDIVVKDVPLIDEIEMKMNELHGIPFVERPPHELPKALKSDVKTYSKNDKKAASNKICESPNIVSSTAHVKEPKEKLIDADSDEEVIEHEPITGDIEIIKTKSLAQTDPPYENVVTDKTLTIPSTIGETDKNTTTETSIITEKEFDKFARRNSVTYENCLTVNFDVKSDNVVQTFNERDNSRTMTNKDILRTELKSKIPQKLTSLNVYSNKSHNVAKYGLAPSESSKNYQSKIHSAYQSVLTAKRQTSQPITIIEDKPVKVVFMDANTEFIPSQLNVQGKELSPTKKITGETNIAQATNIITPDPIETEPIEDNKTQDQTKTKHQRKQVLTPVEAPELELIQPSDIGVDISPKKKRKLEDKNIKNLNKKSYLLGRNTVIDNIYTNDTAVTKETLNRSEELIERNNAASAIDNLVKAAELLENQADNSDKTIISIPDSQENTPVKRGRGRPRKNPIPDDNKTPSPQKKRRVMDVKPITQDSVSEEGSENEGEMIRENWTMGKINENIVCPICNKLFRSENVVFKHVKHCTGVSPNRSDSDKQSPRQSRLSQESEDMELNSEQNSVESKNESPKKVKSKEAIKTITQSDIVVIDDTPGKPDKPHKENTNDYRKANTKVSLRVSSSLVCEFCGKSFRQLSYLVSHKLQHQKEHTTKLDKKTEDNRLQIFNCDICKKEFRKSQHLIQHKIIHNPDFIERVSTRTFNKSSSEQDDSKIVKEPSSSKQSDDPSAAFRCEPCDKSFRKLHHLVEHRETHDGINRQKTIAPVQSVVEPIPSTQCEICNKTFRKLHHLIEHKEQHADGSSDKSDDKSVNSSLTTKDIIHECSICYMVFPNEHSLNKHTVNCAKKKRQSKQPKEAIQSQSGDGEDCSVSKEKKDEISEAPAIILKNITDDDDDDEVIINEHDKNIENIPIVGKHIDDSFHKKLITDSSPTEEDMVTCNENVAETIKQEVEVKFSETHNTPIKRELNESEDTSKKESSGIPAKIKKTHDVENLDISKKRTPLKDKLPATVTKRKKTSNESLPLIKEVKPSVESSDDDEVRYMLNPNYRENETTEQKIFQKVRARKRNSLQIEPPKSKELASRRISLQYMPKMSHFKPITDKSKLTAIESKQKAGHIKPEAFQTKSKTRSLLKAKVMQPKLKVAEPKPKTTKSKAADFQPKAADPKVVEIAALRLKTISNNTKHVPNPPKPKHFLSADEAALSTDSDDSDVKYSFPSLATISKVMHDRAEETAGKKAPRISLSEKRKSLSGIAKRKSLGKVTGKHKVNASPTKPYKRRAAEAEHRCDCGQLFSSAALLARHTSVAHTPPRIRRRRDVSPPVPAQPTKSSVTTDTSSSVKPATTRKSSEKSNARTFTKTAATRKSSVKSDVSSSTKTAATRKSSVKSDASSSTKTAATRKASVKSDASSSIKTATFRKSSVKSDASSSAKTVAPRKSSVKSDASSSTKTVAPRKSSVKSDASSSAKTVATRKSSVQSNASSSAKTATNRKSIVKSDASSSAKTVATRKSSVKSDASSSNKPATTRKSTKLDSTTRKSINLDASIAPKARRPSAHTGVPVPEKMRKMMEKFK